MKIKTLPTTKRYKEKLGQRLDKRYDMQCSEIEQLEDKHDSFNMCKKIT